MSRSDELSNLSNECQIKSAAYCLILEKIYTEEPGLIHQLSTVQTQKFWPIFSVFWQIISWIKGLGSRGRKTLYTPKRLQEAWGASGSGLEESVNWNCWNTNRWSFCKIEGKVGRSLSWVSLRNVIFILSIHASLGSSFLYELLTLIIHKDRKYYIWRENELILRVYLRRWSFRLTLNIVLIIF